MKQDQFYVATKGKKVGPLAISEITQKFKLGQFTPEDFAYDNTVKRWVPLVDICRSADETIEHQSQHSLEAIGERVWFYAEEDKPQGPYSYSEIISLMQGKVIDRGSLVWKEGLENWEPILMLDAFSSEKVKEFYQSHDQTEDIFKQRKYDRKPVKARLIFHNNKTLWVGESFEIGRGGVGAQVEKGKCQIGDVLFVRFQSNDKFSAFNSICEAVSYGQESDLKNGKVSVNFKFKTISRKTFDTIGDL